MGGVDGQKAQCICPTIHECSRTDSTPVCGSDGRTYDSLCHFRVANCGKRPRITVAFPGPCGKGFLVLSVVCLL